VDPYGRNVVIDVRNFLRTSSRRTDIQGERLVTLRFDRFQRESKKIYRTLGHPPDEVPFSDQVQIIVEWVKKNPR